MGKDEAHRVIKAQQDFLSLEDQVVCGYIIALIATTSRAAVNHASLFINAEVASVSVTGFYTAKIFLVGFIREQRQVVVEHMVVFLLEHPSIFTSNRIPVSIVFAVFRHLVNNGKHFVLNRDDQRLSKKWRTGYSQSFGLESRQGKGYMRGEVISNNPFLSMDIHFEGRSYRVATHLVGEYNAHNILAAMSVATSVGLDMESCVKGVEEYRPANHRSQLIEGTEGRCIIADAYNANPSSMMVTLCNLSNTNGAHRVAVLGDMKELGEESLGEHQVIVEWLEEHPEIEVYLVGEEFGKVASNTMAHYCDVQAILARLSNAEPFAPDTVVLLKGSHGIALEQLLPTLQRLVGGADHGR